MNYFLFIDLFIILFIAALIFINYKKGLVKTITRILSFFIAILISLILFKPVSYFIRYNTPIDDNINSYISSIVSSKINNNEEVTEKRNNLPKIFSNYIDKNINKTTDVISLSLTNYTVDIISFIAVFIISRIILLFINILSETLSKLPIVKQFDKLGGFLYGLLEAFLIIFITLAIISFLPIPVIQNSIKNTFLTIYLYNYNPFLLFLF